jgi:hypothetical protein
MFFSQVLYPFVTYLLTLPRNYTRRRVQVMKLLIVQFRKWLLRNTNQILYTRIFFVSVGHLTTLSSIETI